MKLARLLALLLLGLPAAAQTVIDGDTLKVGRQLVRLHGIDAPEKNQSCDRGTWWLGPLAAEALAGFIGKRTVACYTVDSTQEWQASRNVFRNL